MEASDVGYNSFLVISRIGPGLRFEMKMVRDLGKMYLELVISLLGFEGIEGLVVALVERGVLLYDEM